MTLSHNSVEEGDSEVVSVFFSKLFQESFNLIPLEVPMFKGVEQIIDHVLVFLKFLKDILFVFFIILFVFFIILFVFFIIFFVFFIIFFVFFIKVFTGNLFLFILLS